MKYFHRAKTPPGKRIYTLAGLASRISGWRRAPALGTDLLFQRLSADEGTPLQIAMRGFITYSAV